VCVIKLEQLELYDKEVLNECEDKVDELAGVFGEKTHFIRSLRYSLKVRRQK